MVRDLIMEELVVRMPELQGFELGSKEYNAAIEGLKPLLDTVTKIDKDETEHEDNLAVQTEELNIKDAQLVVQRKQAKSDTIIKGTQVVLTGLIGIGGLALTCWGTTYCTNYEEKGLTQTTDPGKNFVKKMFRF